MSEIRDIPVLVVDDQQGIRRMVADILRAAGFKTLYFAEDGQTAWALLQKEKIDLILLDWTMPVMKGIDLLRMVKASEDFNHIKVCMLTAEAQQEDVIEAIKAGTDSYIVKPFTPNTVYQKLSELLGVRIG